MPDETPFNPLDIEHLGESVAEALLNCPVTPLASLTPFDGAGIYAIYYTGQVSPFAPYEPLARRNSEGRFTTPIYVGKAVPSGARKGRRMANAAGQSLYKRLMEHAQSIGQVSNLDIRDFYCRYLTVMDIWIPLGETLLIEQLDPLWNVVIDGFGNHAPGRGRGQGQRPMWDTIHPGRPWAARLAENRRTPLEITQIIQAALAGALVDKLPQDVLLSEADSDED